MAPLAALIDRLGAADRICIGSFSDAPAPPLPPPERRAGLHLDGREPIVAARLTSLAGRMPAFGADCVQVPTAQWGVRIVDRAFVRAAHRGGLQVHVWTIDDRPRWSGCSTSGWTGSCPTGPPCSARCFRAAARGPGRRWVARGIRTLDLLIHSQPLWDDGSSPIQYERLISRFLV